MSYFQFPMPASEAQSRACLAGEQEVVGSVPTGSGNIFHGD